ncbi:glycosyltransferase family 2 protein [Orientia tsutsugamushi]|uniref:glycosyltransferase family 2 protein n=1 Tax=Orientia tsutsugamushi TaxID=784 RepID=UPI0035282BD3
MDKELDSLVISIDNFICNIQDGDIDSLESLLIKGLTTEIEVLDTIQKECRLELINTKQLIKYNVLDYIRQSEYCQKRYLLCTDIDQNKIIVLNNYNPLKIKLIAQHFSTYLVKLISKKDFFALIDNSFKRLNVARSKYLLDLHNDKVNAKNINYVLLTGKIILTLSFLHQFSREGFLFIMHLLYFAHGVLKLLLFKVAMLRYQLHLSSLYYSVELFPFYTILVPLYHEVEKLRDIVKAIELLNYPKNRIEVKIIVEEDDVYTMLELTTMHLAHYFHVIKVPFSFPQTKPKALNYAMNYIVGEYVTVYDAEDSPEPDQLLKVIYHFQNLPPDYQCIQARINFYNKNENVLTKLMSIEYCLWFDFFLYGLTCLGLPVTLGGTSNHCRAQMLKSLGYWDAYNVTEDADLGLRIYIAGFKTAVIDSYTYGEAVIDCKGWLHQRSRWIKGFIQTSFVFMSYNKNIRNRLGVCANICICLFILFSPLMFLFIPLWLISGIIDNDCTLGTILWYNMLFALAYMHVMSWIALCRIKGHWSNLTLQDLLCFIIWPLYSMLHVIASYKAIFELCVKPFKWNKTKHGVSRININ